MLELFTRRGQLTVLMASQYAMSFKSEYLGVEHLLYGLIKKDTGVAATALRNLGLHLEELRTEIEQHFKSRPKSSSEGLRAQTPQAKEAIGRAVEEARIRNHQYAGTGHILLALLRERDGIVTQMIMNKDLKPEDVRQEVLNLLAVGAEDEPGELGMHQGPCLDKDGKRPYRELPVWQKADEMAQRVYMLKARFPPGKTPPIVSRLLEIGLSIPPHLAEAHERRSIAEKQWFLNITISLVRQLQYLLEFSQRLGGLELEDCQSLNTLAEEIDQLLRTLGRSLAS